MTNKTNTPTPSVDLMAIKKAATMAAVNAAVEYFKANRYSMSAEQLAAHFEYIKELDAAATWGFAK